MPGRELRSTASLNPAEQRARSVQIPKDRLPPQAENSGSEADREIRL